MFRGVIRGNERDGTTTNKSGTPVVMESFAEGDEEEEEETEESG